jgi:hypothetical protein
LPPEVLAMGFDPVRVGARYEVPLQRLPRQRNILDGLQRFEDVRAFYERERMEKGHPDVEG